MLYSDHDKKLGSTHATSRPVANAKKDRMMKATTSWGTLTGALSVALLLGSGCAQDLNASESDHLPYVSGDAGVDLGESSSALSTVIASALTRTLNQGIVLESLSSSKGGTSSNFFTIGSQTPYPIYAAGHNNSGERAEVKTPRVSLGGTYAFGVRYHPDSAFNTDGGYRIIMQHAWYENASSPPGGFFSTGNGGCGGVGSMVIASGSNISFRMSLPRNGTGVQCVSAPLYTLSQVRNRYFDVVVHFRASTGNDGFYHVYTRLEGETSFTRRLERNNVPTGWTRMNSTAHSGRSYFKAGVYSGDPGKGSVTVRMSQLRLATALSDAMPDGGSASPSPAPTPVNLALGAVVTASASQLGQPATLAADGDIRDESRWSAQGYPQTISFDFQAEATLDAIEVLPFQNRAYRYLVESSDGRLLVDRTNNTTSASVLRDELRGTRARGVRVTVTGCSGSTCSSQNWVSLREVRIFGTR